MSTASPELEVKFFAAWWGMDGFGLEPMLERIRNTGYDGVEIGIPKEKALQIELRTLLQKYNLEVIMDIYRKIGTGVVMIVPTFVGGGAVWNIFNSWILVFIWIIIMAAVYSGILTGKLPKARIES